MLSKCIQCNFIRNRIHIKTFRTSPCIFNESQQHSKPETTQNASKPKRKTLLDAMEKYTKYVSVEPILGKESFQTLLKVQKVTKEISADFKMIYKFPYIRYFGLINRLKVYQTIISVIASGGVVGLSALGIVSPEFITTTIGVAISGCAFFYSLGFATTRFIGFIYFNENANMVHIAYVDFWGRRRDVQVPVNDIIPRTELPASYYKAVDTKIELNYIFLQESIVDKVWHRVVRYSTNETLKLQLQTGKILDLEALNKIL